MYLQNASKHINKNVCGATGGAESTGFENGLAATRTHRAPQSLLASLFHLPLPASLHPKALWPSEPSGTTWDSKHHAANTPNPQQASTQGESMDKQLTGQLEKVSRFSAVSRSSARTEPRVPAALTHSATPPSHPPSTASSCPFLGCTQGS